MRIAIASRIFAPEASAASFRLTALARALSEAGHDVTVLTVHPPKKQRGAGGAGDTGYAVKRWPVLRDKSGYVRGYVQYMSFDIPLLFRVLFSKKFDVIISEPPPTTGFFVRIASWFRRTPYVYYAADIWSEAALQTGAPSWMISIVQRIERAALAGSSLILSVSDEVTTRVTKMIVPKSIITIGNGVDTEQFRAVEPAECVDYKLCTFIYAGTASEWHGAEVFVLAMQMVLREVPEATLCFIGGGSAVDELSALATTLGISSAVSFEPGISPSRLAPRLRAATGALASVRPNSSYEFAFPTKLYSAAACGTPMVYSGAGPAQRFVETVVDHRSLGISVTSDVAEVAAAMLEMITNPGSPSWRANVIEWAATHVDLSAVAQQAVASIEEVPKGKFGVIS